MEGSGEGILRKGNKNGAKKSKNRLMECDKSTITP